MKTELLLQHGANIHASDVRQDTLVHLAVRQGPLDCVRRFMAAGFEFHTRGNLGHTVLHCAVDGGEWQLEHLLEREGGKRIINVQDPRGVTPLDYAVSTGAGEQ